VNFTEISIYRQMLEYRFRQVRKALAITRTKATIRKSNNVFR
jgi:hypothetical protein